MIYFEAELKVRMKSQAGVKYPKAFINHVTLGFDHKPSGWYEIQAELAHTHPYVDLVDVERVWNATHKAEELCEYYDTHSFTGD